VADDIPSGKFEKLGEVKGGKKGRGDLNAQNSY
jgi:hypothetical protein